MERTCKIPPDDGSIQIDRTPRDVGGQCTLTVTRYDKPGMRWAINGRPQTSLAAVMWVLSGVLMTLEEEA